MEKNKDHIHSVDSDLIGDAELGNPRIFFKKLESTLNGVVLNDECDGEKKGNRTRTDRNPPNPMHFFVGKENDEKGPDQRGEQNNTDEWNGYHRNIKYRPKMMVAPATNPSAYV